LFFPTGGIMAKEKSILEKFSDTVKGLADSASQALKSEEPARVDETTAAYMPFAAEGLVSDPLLLPPVATPPPRRKCSAKKVAGRGATRSAKKSTKKSARKTARKSASARSKQVIKTTKRSAGPMKAARKRGRR
jgi:hypothetical protein